ncbi:hypothetical protein EYF80_023740 [Liparis tanakae]|uniref:C-type lectin domain-containing protein n=1 Tax=Liparis tanakae TaxID=230148 RepID=A0A4Z2HM17_9TELE|nr:hypothetical protein EYF80_023740 [Liparis tanakae]
MSNTSVFIPEDIDSSQWSINEPSNSNNEEHCGAMAISGLWFDMHCEASVEAVCFDDTGPNTYVLTPTVMKWADAQSYCREHHTDLASVRSMAENQMVLDQIFSGSGAWIGLFKGPWKWSDGTDFSTDAQWEALDCDVMSASICYTDVPPVSKRMIKVRLEKSSSSLDLNDPVVMEDLLKKLKQRMKDQGVNENFKLSWKKQSDGKVFHKEDKGSGLKRRYEL